MSAAAPNGVRVPACLQLLACIMSLWIPATSGRQHAGEARARRARGGARAERRGAACAAGVLGNKLLPSWLVTLVLILLLAFLTWRMVSKAWALLRAELKLRALCAPPAALGVTSGPWAVGTLQPPASVAERTGGLCSDHGGIRAARAAALPCCAARVHSLRGPSSPRMRPRIAAGCATMRHCHSPLHGLRPPLADTPWAPCAQHADRGRRRRGGGRTGGRRHGGCPDAAARAAVHRAAGRPAPHRVASVAAPQRAAVRGPLAASVRRAGPRGTAHGLFMRRRCPCTAL